VDEWGAGRYEETALELAPAADAAVAALGLEGGERVLDVACGTGNAAVLAREAGARVTGLDGSRRLLEVATGRVPDGEFVLGDAARLPFDDAQFDAVVSVFGVIFARPGERAAAELARVVRPGGRVAVTTWPPRGPLFPAIGLMRRALSRGRPADGPPPLDWGNPAVLERTLSPHGKLTVSERHLAQASASPEQIWDRWERWHPMWISAREGLEPAGEWDRLRQASIAALAESAAGPTLRSPYLLAVLERH
jgi:SAM-dependent methyltransferase